MEHNAILTLEIDEDDNYTLYLSHTCYISDEDHNEERYEREQIPTGKDLWLVISCEEEPLTVSPSIHCIRCEFHGTMTNGVWV